MLFSEPKISQSHCRPARIVLRGRFSALQRAENFSMNRSAARRCRLPTFQCSSASRKFLNLKPTQPLVQLQRVSVLFSEPKISQFKRQKFAGLRACRFQCSSASRKFLNHPQTHHSRRPHMFQCSSASRKFLNQQNCRKWYCT